MKPTMTDWFDKYLFNQMEEDEKKEFCQALQQNKQLKHDFENYQKLIESFQKYHKKNELENKFNEWYLQETALNEKAGRRIWWTVSYVAASVALLVTLTGIWFYERIKDETKKQVREITYLKKEIKQIQTAQNRLVKKFQKIEQQKYTPANSQSTGFLIASRYVITTYHSIQNADSVFIENDNYPFTEAKVVYVNKDLDLALLYAPYLDIINPGIHSLNKQADIGDKVFTIGFPTSQLVYNEGYISAANGYNNDSAYYQITLPLNPGNSGGPLFNAKGELIGVIVSKNVSMEGVAFALKSKMLYALKDSLPSDSIKQVWVKAFKKYPASLNKNTSIQKFKPFVFKVYTYQKSI